MENLVPIGRFSKMTRLSVKALRHYDELGLLVPAGTLTDLSGRVGVHDNDALFDELLEEAFAQDGVGDVEAGELALLWVYPRQVERFQDPLVERPVHLELHSAQ